MPIQVAGQVGPQGLSDGTGLQPFRQGRLGEIVVQELHGRFYEQTSRGNVFSSGMTLTAISNVTFTTGTLGATCTPIIGLWNPASNVVNAVVLQAVLGTVLTALQNTGGGPFVWAYAVGQSAISTGIAPVNRRTLAATSSAVKAFANTALTGLSGNLTVGWASALGGGNTFNIASLDTAAGFSTIYQPTVENFDGSIIVPPGGILALLATTTPVAHSAASAIVWEEVPV